MKNGIWYCIGVMSGTSLDGVDLAYIKFNNNNSKIEFIIIESVTIPYNSFWKEKITDAFSSFPNSKLINELDIEYGKYLGILIKSFITENHIQNLDFVASHGHTIFHDPTKGFTLQIGDGKTIANTCGQTVVCNFRAQDIALGGQGAPLVPIGDRLLFSQYDNCINIGGFANISFEKDKKRKAFDICPANIVLNHYTREIGLEYDDKGQLAKTGTIQKELLNSLNKLTFYKKNNSMGNEQVVSTVIPLINSFKLPVQDILCTMTEHIAIKISSLLPKKTETLVTGGGVLNAFLIDRIKYHTTATIVIPSEELIHYKEALIFGLLGLLRLENKINILASYSGALRNHSSGLIYSPSMDNTMK